MVFREGLNFVLGKITSPSARDKDKAMMEDEETRREGMGELPICYCAMEDWQSAIEAIDRILQREPTNWSAWYCRTLIARAAGDEKEVNRVCVELLRQHGHSTDKSTLQWVSGNLLAAGEVFTNTQALVSLAKRAYSEPKAHYEFVCLAHAYCRKEQYEQAIETLMKSLRLPDYEPVHSSLCLAIAHQELGNTKEARRWFQKAAAALERPPLGQVATTWWGYRQFNKSLRDEVEQLLRDKLDQSNDSK